MKIRTKINTHGNKLPHKAKSGDWYDLYAAEDAIVWWGQSKILSLGISIELPEGCTGYILPRSSTPRKFGIAMANSMGVIDHDYCGDNDIWGFVAIGIKFPFARIKKGDRIAQMGVYPSPIPLAWVQTKLTGNKDRGGFGTTGTR